MTSQQPLVSIVVNNYNHAAYLEACLDALLAQSYSNIEIIAVDAYSNDNSRQILVNYALKDPRVKVVLCSQYEKFPAVTYNLGFLNCRGDFIAVADPDDISLPHRIEVQLIYLLTHPLVDACGMNCREFNDSQDILVETTLERNLSIAAPPIRNPTLMCRKYSLARFGLWNCAYEPAADFEWLYRWFRQGAKFVLLPECGVMYRYAYGGNISVRSRLDQTAKLASLRLYFGLFLLRGVGQRWWLVTCRTWLSWLKQWLVALVGRVVTMPKKETGRNR